VKIIAGLGNPGILYAGSRHNIGFEVIKSFARVKGVVLKKEKGIKALTGKYKNGRTGVLLVLPLTFMNLSAEALRPIVKRYEVEPGDLLVIHDDLDLDFGRIKVCSKGSSAGHRGVKSIIDSFRADSFNRLRIGIGRPRETSSQSDFVLAKFNRREKGLIPGIIDNAIKCLGVWEEEGIEKAMNIFNRKEIKGA